MGCKTKVDMLDRITILDVSAIAVSLSGAQAKNSKREVKEL